MSDTADQPSEPQTTPTETLSPLETTKIHLSFADWAPDDQGPKHDSPNLPVEERDQQLLLAFSHPYSIANAERWDRIRIQETKGKEHIKLIDDEQGPGDALFLIPAMTMPANHLLGPYGDKGRNHEQRSKIPAMELGRMKFGFALVEDGSNNPVLSFQHQIGQACLNEQQTKVMHFAGAKDSEPLHWSRNVYGWTRSDSNTGGRFIPVTQAMFRDVKTLTSPLSPGGKQSVKELIAQRDAIASGAASLASSIGQPVLVEQGDCTVNPKLGHLDDFNHRYAELSTSVRNTLPINPINLFDTTGKAIHPLDYMERFPEASLCVVGVFLRAFVIDERPPASPSARAYRERTQPRDFGQLKKCFTATTVFVQKLPMADCDVLTAVLDARINAALAAQTQDSSTPSSSPKKRTENDGASSAPITPSKHAKATKTAAAHEDDVEDGAPAAGSSAPLMQHAAVSGDVPSAEISAAATSSPGAGSSTGNKRVGKGPKPPVPSRAPAGAAPSTRRTRQGSVAPPSGDGMETDE